MRALTIFTFAVLSLSATRAQAEDMNCMAKFHTKSGVKEAFPGSLGARAGTPCFVAIYTTPGKNNPGDRRIVVLKQPQNGRFTATSANGFPFEPNPGFTGQDVGVVRITNGQTGSAIRFAIDVR